MANSTEALGSYENLNNLYVPESGVIDGIQVELLNFTWSSVKEVMPRQRDLREAEANDTAWPTELNADLSEWPEASTELPQAA